MNTIHLTVPGVFPSLNVLLGWHWAKRNRHRASIESDIDYTLKVHGIFPVVGKKRMAVFITIYQPFRRLDQDNAEGSMKPVIDSLRSLGLIYRDSPKWLKKTIEQKVDRECPRVEITIAEILYANTYYVDGENGSDTNIGTSVTAAKKTIQNAVRQCGSGDAVIVMAQKETK